MGIWEKWKKKRIKKWEERMSVAKKVLKEVTSTGQEGANVVKMLKNEIHVCEWKLEKLKGRL